MAPTIHNNDLLCTYFTYFIEYFVFSFLCYYDIIIFVVVAFIINV